MASSYAEYGAATPQVAPRPRLQSVLEMLELLEARGLLVAPLVAARLFTELNGDADAALEVVAVLSPGQRRGTRAIPNPLPLTPVIEELFADLTIEAWERRMLLAAAVCVDDSTDVLRAVCDRSMPEIIASEISRRLLFVAGHFSFVDPRLRIWAHESADLAARTEMHAALCGFYADLADDRRALWHRSLSAMQGDPGLTGALLELADDAARSGDAERAFEIAREAASHAGAAEVGEARTAAGLAALCSGLLDDAEELLGGVVAVGARRGGGRSAVAAAGLVVARTLRSGVVPAVETARIRPDGCSGREWGDWGRLAAFLAMLSAERGADSESQRWLALAVEADAACDADGAVCGSAEAWVALLCGDGAEEADGGPPVFAHILEALRLGLAGRMTEGIGILSGDDCIDAEGSAARGYERSPLIRAYRATVEALLRLWAGDLRSAREVLVRASLEVPLALPFGGLAVVLARRLELAESGRSGPISAALASALPASLYPDRFVERGMAAYLDGRFDEAATQIGLWVERGGSAPCFGLPGLDEVGPVGFRPALEPPDITAARRIRAGIRAARANAWGHDYRAAAAASRSIRSPFERARVEALLGTTCVTRGERAAGLRHLRVARSLFADAGAPAWETAAAARLAQLGDQPAEQPRLPTAPIPIVSADPLAACRAAWEPLLTERELQVAMLVAEGRTNREIALRLHIALRTVEVHIGRLFSKFDVRSRGELTVLAHRTNQYA